MRDQFPEAFPKFRFRVRLLFKGPAKREIKITIRAFAVKLQAQNRAFIRANPTKFRFRIKKNPLEK
jgi:hypothetical protein